MQTIEITVETPKGSPVKYNYDPATDHFKLRKVLPAGMVFPYDFGFIPGTKGQDGDPLDVIIISEFGTFPGCRIACRLVGCLRVVQTAPKSRNKKIRNDRFIAIPVQTVVFENIKTLKDLPAGLTKELEAFFIQYKKLENIDLKVTGRAGAEGAYQLLKQETIRGK